MISIGNFNNTKNGFNILKFDDIHCNKKNQNKWKWNEMKLNTQRPQPSAAMIDDDRIITCGGYRVYNHCDLYDFNTKIWTNLASTKEERHNNGICADKLYNKRVYIGGGSMNKYKKFEYYDIYKNEWYLLADTNDGHKFHPILWMESSNVIYIASAWSNSIERMDVRENKWTLYVSNNSSKTFENIFGTIIPYNDDVSVRVCL